MANEKAELEGLNSFETGTITSNDLVNQSEYDGEGFGISGGYGYQNDGPNNPKGTNPTQIETVNLPDGSHSVNKNVGYGKDKESESSVTQSGIGTGNIKVTDNDKQQELTGQTAEEAAQSAITDMTTETVADNSGALANIFDKDKVQAEIDLQVKVTQQFDRTRQDMKQIINQKIDQYKDSDPDKAKDWQNAGLLLDMLSGGLSSPGEGLGIVAGAANPAVAQIIKDLTTGDNALKEGGLGHILAHGIAGAAMAAANGGDLLSGALTAGGAEALAPIIAEFLYGDRGKNPEELNADEKNTLSAIIGILGTGAGALTGDSAIDAVIGDSVATNAVENNLTHNKAGSNKLPERLKELDAKIAEHLPSMEEFQEKYEECSTSTCREEVRKEYYIASEAGDQKIIELYESGKLSKEEFLDFISDYKKAMLAGADSLINSTGDIADISTREWLKGLGNEKLSAIFIGIKIDEMIANGDSPEKIEDVILQNQMISGLLGITSHTDILKAIDTGDIAKLVAGAIVGKAVSPSGKGDINKPSTGKGKQPEDSIWSENKKGSSVDNAYGHWDKHKNEFPEFQNSKQYVDAAHDFMRNPPQGTLSKTRPNGDIVYYDPKTNIFAVKNAEGIPKTMFKLSRIQRAMVTQQIRSITMHNKDFYKCRVCGLLQETLPWGEDGKSPSYNICYCCGVEFGYEDCTLVSIKNYREKWIESGGKWNKKKYQPINWSLAEQLLNIPKQYT